MSAGEVRKLARKVGVTHYQWASKGELVTLLTETDLAKVAAAKDSIEAKHAKWAEKHGGKPKKAKPSLGGSMTRFAQFEQKRFVPYPPRKPYTAAHRGQPPACGATS